MEQLIFEGETCFSEDLSFLSRGKGQGWKKCLFWLSLFRGMNAERVRYPPTPTLGGKGFSGVGLERKKRLLCLSGFECFRTYALYFGGAFPFGSVGDE